MDTVSETDMAIAMARHGGMAIIHRYNPIYAQEKMVSDAFAALAQDPTVGEFSLGAAVGVTDDYLARVGRVADAGANVICIDVAHGHHSAVERALKTIRDHYGDTFHIMAGNVATCEAYEALAEWGADSVRVGIGGGSICSTRLVTGHGVPTLASVLECANSGHAAAIIADGGIKNSGDMVKALAAGADFVMCGSLLAGTDEAPGDEVQQGGVHYKTYRGMASRDAQISWRGSASSAEGVSTILERKGPVGEVLDSLSSGLASGFSYSGAYDISELWLNAQFVRQTSAGQRESTTHIRFV